MKRLVSWVLVVLLGAVAFSCGNGNDNGTGTDSDTDTDTDTDTDADTDTDTDTDSDIPDDCEPTELNAEFACTPGAECCGFPAPDDHPELDWEDGECYGGWESGDSYYSIDCEDLNGKYPICYCEEEEGSLICEPTTQELDEACTPAEESCEFPDADGEVIYTMEEAKNICGGTWENGDYVYSIVCEGVGSEYAYCECFQEEAYLCTPTTADETLACAPLDQCCGFPTTADEMEGEDWPSGCEVEYLSGDTYYRVRCGGLDSEDALCSCQSEDYY